MLLRLPLWRSFCQMFYDIVWIALLRLLHNWKGMLVKKRCERGDLTHSLFANAMRYKVKISLGWASKIFPKFSGMDVALWFSFTTLRIRLLRNAFFDRCLFYFIGEKNSLPIHLSAVCFLFALPLFELLVACFGSFRNSGALLANLWAGPGLQDHFL